MKRSFNIDLNRLESRNESGAALWSVLLITLVILIMITSTVTFLLEHRKFLHMRQQQVQATELVKNGVNHIRSWIGNNDELKVGVYTLQYQNGTVTIDIKEILDEQVNAVVSGFISNVIQSYKVTIQFVENKVTNFEKVVLLD